MKSTLTKLRAYFPDSTASERQFLQFLLSDPMNIVNLDIHAIANKCFCSTSTIVRVCKKIGFAGFKELKMHVVNDIAMHKTEVRSLDGGMLAENGEKRIGERIAHLNSSSIKGSIDLLNPQELEIFVDLLEKNQFVHLYGIGASCLVQKDFQMKLERISYKSSLYEDIHMQLINSNNVKSGEVAFIMSYSGQTSEILQIARNIKGSGGVIVSVTKHGYNELASISDIAFQVPAIEGDLRICAGPSRIAQLNLIDTIFYTLFYRVQEKSLDKIVETKEMLKKEKDRFKKED